MTIRRFFTKPMVTLAITSVTAVGFVQPVQAAVGDFTEVAMPAYAAPYGVVLGPDGNIWVANGGGANSISRVTPAGVVTNFPLPGSGSNPRFITVGSDRNVWFTEQSSNKIGRITMTGAITEFPVPTANAEPWGIAPGPDGALWFTEIKANKIGRITTAGAITEWQIPTPNSQPWGITAAPKGEPRMYFTEQAGNKIGTIWMSGSISEVPLAAGSAPLGIAVSEDLVWFAESGSGKLGRLVGSTALEVSFPSASQPTMLADGPGPSIWITMNGTNQLVRMAANGSVVGTYSLPASARPMGLDMGSDGNMWVAETFPGKVARVLSGQIPMIATPPGITPASNINVGTMLTAANGSWSYAPTTYAYVWQRCSSQAVNTCTVPISTASQYTVQAGDANQYLRLGVTASSANGSSSTEYSAPVPVGSSTAAPVVVPTVPPTPTVVPTVTTVTGPAKQKRKATKTYTARVSANATGTVTFSFRASGKQRIRRSPVGASGVTQVRWRVPARWPRGQTSVTASFQPAVPATFTYSSGAMRVRIR